MNATASLKQGDPMIEREGIENKPPHIVLVGSPNCGKTSLFNLLTGAHQRVGNFPGITVERKIGRFSIGESQYELVDLPGFYSLDTHSFDEKVARDYILGLNHSSSLPDLVLSVVDATNLERSLYHVLELKEAGLSVVVCLNLMDLAKKRGLDLDIHLLERELGFPVIPMAARSGEGKKELLEAIGNNLKTGQEPKIPSDFLRRCSSIELIHEKFKKIEDLLLRATIQGIKPDHFTARLDKLVLHPVLGVILLLGALFILFQALFSWAGPLTEMLEGLVEWVCAHLKGNLGHPLLESFVLDGVIAGVGNVIVFLPQILLLFAFILFLEDFGYLGRAAFLMDSLLRKLGLPGRSVVPLLSSHACAIPGIMAARTIENYQDRMAVILVSPLTVCSARIPVYAVLIAALVPKDLALGPFNMAGISLFFLYLLGIASAFVAAFVLRKSVLHGSPSTLLMELPPYRLPRLKNILSGLLHRSMIFLKKAGTVILALSVVLWLLVTFPRPDGAEPDVIHSYAGTVGRFVQPVFAPLGYDWKITTALIPAFGAREVMVASMGTVLSVESDDDEEVERMLTSKVQKEYPPAVLLSLILWFAFAPQCISTFAILKRETDGWKWPAFVFVYMLVLAYVAAFLGYVGFSALFPS